MVSLGRNHGCALGFLKKLWSLGTWYLQFVQHRKGMASLQVVILFFCCCSGLKQAAFKISYQKRDTLITSKTDCFGGAELCTTQYDINAAATEQTVSAMKALLTVHAISAPQPLLSPLHSLCLPELPVPGFVICKQSCKLTLLVYPRCELMLQGHTGSRSSPSNYLEDQELQCRQDTSIFGTMSSKAAYNMVR